MASFKGEPGFRSKVFIQNRELGFTPSHLRSYGVQPEKPLNLIHRRIFFSLPPPVPTSSGVRGLCLGTTDPVLDGKCQCPPQPVSLFLRVSGS